MKINHLATTPPNKPYMAPESREIMVAVRDLICTSIQKWEEDEEDDELMFE